MTLDNKSSDIRPNWRLNWLGCIRDFSDYDTQVREWLNVKNINPHWSYIEYMCSYFDGCAIEECGGYEGLVGEGFITQPEADAVAKFHEVAKAHKSPDGNDYDNCAILSDPKWIELVNSAQQAKLSLLNLLANTDEIAALE